MALTRQKPASPAVRMEAPDHDSWNDWFQNYGPRLLLYARQWTRSAADAEDIVQEAFVRFWRHQRRLGGEPLPLLFVSIRRAAFDLARRRARRAGREAAAGEEREAETPAFTGALDGRDRRAAIEHALRLVPEEQREILVLKIWGGLTFEQIGAQLGLPPNTAASRYRYGLEALRRRLTPADLHG